MTKQEWFQLEEDIFFSALMGMNDSDFWSLFWHTLQLTKGGD